MFTLTSVTSMTTTLTRFDDGFNVQCFHGILQLLLNVLQHDVIIHNANAQWLFSEVKSTK